MRKYLAVCAIALLSISPAYPADHTLHHMQTATMSDSSLPIETGQSAFAAIQEVVAKLEADPKTDWSKVNIEALRQHLIDMNNVTLSANVRAQENTDGITFIISGEGAVRESIRRMVKGHADTMNGRDGWNFTTIDVDNGATLTVTPPKKVSMAEVRALGFIGIMTRGMHHQTHHWMIAAGSNPHH